MSRAWLLWFVLLAVAASGCRQHKISMQPGPRTFTPESYISIWDAWTREKESFSWKELAHESHVSATFESWEFRWAYVVRYAYDKGVNYFDTAEGYGNGAAERAIGEAMQHMDRDKIFIASKSQDLGRTRPSRH